MTADWTASGSFRLSGLANADGTGQLAFQVTSTYAADADISTITVSYKNPVNNPYRWVISLFNGAGTEITSVWSGWTYNSAYHGYYKDTFSGITSATLTGLPAGVRKVYFGIQGTTQNAVTSIDYLQIEAKSYATSFTDSDRSAELLSSPLEGFNSDTFTIEAIITPRKSGDGKYIFSINAGEAERFNFMYNDDGTLVWEYHKTGGA
jgi:hypothetical protein